MRWARLVLLVAAFGLVCSAVAGYQGRRGGGGPAWGAARGGWVLAAAALVLGACRVSAAGLWFEYRLRWRFKAVCERSGLAVKDKQGRAYYPRVGQLVGDRDGFSVRIRPLIGQTVAQWEKAAAAFALAYG